ncbi:MAG TPA: glycosyltransferase family 4 protein [Bryobacteraceae bacterium]|nr:glycosyltransferase family 4 protein [Bryobacteraceae bacterium]
MLHVPRSNGKRFAFVIGWPLNRLGGVSEVVKNLLREFAQAGNPAPLLLEMCQADAAPVSFDESPVLRVDPVSPCNPNRPLRALAVFCSKLPVVLWRWRKLCREIEIDVLNPHFIGPDYLILALLRGLGLFRGTLILSFHGSDVHRLHQTRGLERLLCKILLRQADWLVPCSEVLAEQVRRFAPGCSHRIRTIRNGIDCDRFVRSADPAFELPPRFAERTRIVSIGAFRRLKGHDILLRAFAQVRSANACVCLIIAGGDAAEFHNTEQLVKALGLEDDVLLLRNLPHFRVAALLSAADLFVLPSRRESFGLVLLEAGAFGKPVVACEVGIVSELITEGVNGWRVPVENTELLARAIENALADPAESARRGRNLRMRIQTSFTWRQARQQYLEIAARRAPEPQWVLREDSEQGSDRASV